MRACMLFNIMFHVLLLYHVIANDVTLHPHLKETKLFTADISSTPSKCIVFSCVRSAVKEAVLNWYVITSFSVAELFRCVPKIEPKRQIECNY